MNKPRETRSRPSAHLALAVLCLLTFPAVSHAVLISNGISEGTVGHFRVDVLTGGESRDGFVTAQRFSSQDIFTENVLFDYFSFVDLGERRVVRLSGSVPVPDPNNPNSVSSSGSFVLANENTILWEATSAIEAGSQVMTTRFRFENVGGGPLGPLRFLQYLDEDVESNLDNVFLGAGSASGGTLELFTFHNTEVYGVSQSGEFISGPGLQNGVFAGWAAGEYPLMRNRITGGSQLVSVDGVIEDNLPSFDHPKLGPVFGPKDITSVLAWDVDPNGTTAAITTSLGGVPESSNLELTKTDSPDPVKFGSNLTYTVKVTNNGPSDATGVTVTDPLPGGVSLVSATPSQGSCRGTATVTCLLGSLANGESATVAIIVVTPTLEGVLSNTASVAGNQTDPNPVDNSANQPTTVVIPPPDIANLAVTKTGPPDPVMVGTDLTYTVNVTNNGPSDATGVIVTDSLPGGVSLVSATPSKGSCSGTATVTCPLGSLANGESATVAIVVTPTSEGALSNTARVAGNQTDRTPGNDSATETTRVNPAPSANLALTKTDAPDPVTVGTNLTYTITVTNNGPNDATGVTVTDPLPGGVSLVSATPSQGSCSGTSTVSCALGSLANRTTATVTIVVISTSAGAMSNTANVTGSPNDPNLRNNSATETTTVNPPLPPPPSPPAPPAAPDSVTDPLVLSNPRPFGCEFKDGEVTCVEARGTPPFIKFDVNIPSDARFLQFGFSFAGADGQGLGAGTSGASDAAVRAVGDAGLSASGSDLGAIFLGNIPIAALRAPSGGPQGVFQSSGQFRLTSSGTSTLTIASFPSGAAGSVFRVRNLRIDRCAQRCFGKRATICGTEGSDILTGTRRRDVILGRGGDDTIRGLGGDDRICSGAGRDELRGGTGDDRCDGQSGRDTARGCERRRRIP